MWCGLASSGCGGLAVTVSRGGYEAVHRDSEPAMWAVHALYGSNCGSEAWSSPMGS